MGGGEFGVAVGVYCANVGKFLVKAGQLGLNTDIDDIGVVGLALTMRQVPVSVRYQHM